MTLIDKAEALLPCPFCGRGAHVSKTGGSDERIGYCATWTVRCMSCSARVSCMDTTNENGWSNAEEGETKSRAIATWNRRAALPARGVGVKPLDLDDEQTSRAAKFMAMALWSELHEKAGEGVLPETLPKPAADVLRKLMQEKLAVLAPTDAAQAREAALREAADSLLEASVWCDSQERTSPEWHNGVADARKHHIARILALIGGSK